MRIFDFSCAACAHTFEVFVQADTDPPLCPQCGSAAVARRPVTQIAIRTGKARRGRTIDLSSNSCPCGHGGGNRASR
jgi:putative FmdB family regulatory protein